MTVSKDLLDISTHLLAALAAGGAIGLERSFHGRPAGFRTHTLVCLASSLLMLVTLYQANWIPGGAAAELFRTDPTRMAQGIMTGIGFLGAGVIFKEGLSVRGLTTAASIWMTAAIGVLLGIGFYYPAILATFLTLGTLSLFRWIEARMPAHSYAQHVLRFDRDKVLEEDEVRKLLHDHGFTVANMSYRMIEAGAAFEYRMVIRTAVEANTGRLAKALRQHREVREFRISPTGD
jgi:putative Mg2+ transporter-C (MgtC) family protein